MWKKIAFAFITKWIPTNSYNRNITNKSKKSFVENNLIYKIPFQTHKFMLDFVHYKH